MHMYAKCDKNISCGSRVIRFSLTGNGRMDGRTFSREIQVGYKCVIKMLPRKQKYTKRDMILSL